MESKRVVFDLGTDSLDFKPILKKDFLELSMRVISSANPNRNGSWFTLESMQKSIYTFANKPILGYFENEDFVSHNGQWKKDDETGMDYWDVWGRQGERMLGLIRESDEVKIVKGSDGLDWIELRCAIWVQYNFKQVKRLLKDAKRALKEGGVAKNVSVEVDITDWDELDNGIIKINEFKLVGITILGSRNGVKVEPGIENAGLSVLDIMGKDMYEKQQSLLRQAYAKLDDDGDNNKKEEFSRMDENNNVTGVLPTSDSTQNENNNIQSQENADPNSNGLANFAEDGAQPEVCPECGQNPCVCEKHDDDDDDDKDEENNGGEENKPEEQEAQQQEPVQNESCPENKVEENEQGGVENNCGPNFEELQAKYDELYQKYTEAEKTIEEHDNVVNELNQKYEQLNEAFNAKTKELEEAQAKLSQYAHEEFLKEAYALIDSAKLDEASSCEFRELCEKGDVTELQDLKTRVALKLFESINQNNSQTNVQEDKEKKEEKPVSFSSPINEPNTDINKKNNKKVDNASPWDTLNDYVGK